MSRSKRQSFRVTKSREFARGDLNFDLYLREASHIFRLSIRSTKHHTNTGLSFGKFARFFLAVQRIDPYSVQTAFGKFSRFFWRYKWWPKQPSALRIGFRTVVMAEASPLCPRPPQSTAWHPIPPPATHPTPSAEHHWAPDATDGMAT